MIKFNFELNENNEILNHRNRGMSLEKEINESNQYYIDNDIAIIHKKATPISVVKCVGDKITEAYFDEKSTTDYNGVFNGYYIDFEAKSTTNKTRFPFSNIRENQIEHHKKVIKAKGIAFFIIEFSKNELYLLVPSIKLIKFVENTKSSSISLDELKTFSYEVPRTIEPPLDYIHIVETHLSEFL